LSTEIVLPDTQFARRGNVFVATAGAGFGIGEDPPPEAVAEAFAAAFESLASAVRDGGQSLDEVGRILVTVPDRAHRGHLDQPWLDLFPGEDRPARRTTTAPVDSGGVIQLSAMGVAGAARTQIHLDGLAGEDPVPNGVRIGAYFFSSALVSDAPGGERPAGAERIEQAWRNFDAFVAAAGASLDDVLNVWVYLGDWDRHDRMVDAWVRRFPDGNWPSRKTFRYPETSIELICEGVVGAGPRQNYELDGLAHHDPIPLAASLGAVLTTSGVGASDPATKVTPSTLPAQADQALTNIASMLEPTRFDPGSVLAIVALVPDEAGAVALRAVGDRLRAGGSGPVLEVLQLGRTGRGNSTQLLARCVAG
jgi:enamine deaminase RidA (YjgF/YER057c/UK114 family)